MSWLSDLAAALEARRIPRRERRRILLELEDHLECAPGCESRMGDPRELASRFADELATSEARSSAFQAFGALAVTAVALVASQLALGAGGSYPGFDHGLSLALLFPALLGMVVAPQAALVAGTLAAVRALRRRGRRRLPAAEIALIRRRSRVALGAGLATMGGLELYVADFSQRLPGWWLGMTAALGVVGTAALLTAWRRLARTAAVVGGTPGPAGDLLEDLPLPGADWLRRAPWRIGAVASLLAGLAITAVTGHAEHSLLEGLQRGMLEGIAAAVGFTLLGRTIGARPAPLPATTRAPRPTATPRGPHTSAPPPWADALLVGDADRSRAELVLRQGYADGRLTLAELTERVIAVHRARTAGELRALLADLPG